MMRTLALRSRGMLRPGPNTFSRRDLTGPGKRAVADVGSPFRLLCNSPGEGQKPARVIPLAKAMLSLDWSTNLGKPVIVQVIQFPGFAPDVGPASPAGF